jgi:hypothetical protein
VGATAYNNNGHDDDGSIEVGIEVGVEEGKDGDDNSQLQQLLLRC